MREGGKGGGGFGSRLVSSNPPSCLIPQRFPGAEVRMRGGEAWGRIWIPFASSNPPACLVSASVFLGWGKNERGGGEGRGRFGSRSRVPIRLRVWFPPAAFSWGGDENGKDGGRGQGENESARGF
jgi:hypothetical protein